MTEAKRCPAGHEMRVELDRPLVAGNGVRVVLWYCEVCDYAEHEVRPA